MTPENYLTKTLLLPHLKLIKVERISKLTLEYTCVKTTYWEICRKCPTKSYDVHDRRTVTIRDQKTKNKNVRLKIIKRRFRCPNCKVIFTEIVDGIKPGFRTTENYRGQILHDFKHYENASKIAYQNRCSSTLVTTVINERLKLDLKKSDNTPWGKTVLIDEHGFKRNKKKARREMVTALVDNKRQCLRELAYSKDAADIKKAIEHIPGRENVSHVVIDMDDQFKNFATDFFNNAEIVVDKFHVIRLAIKPIGKYRREVTGDKRSNPIRHLLQKNRKRLKPHQKRAVTRFCKLNENLNEVYRFKERIVNFYNIKGYNQANRIFTKITDDMALSKIPEIQSFRKTLMKWRKGILRYFKTGLTNGRIEGFNRKCKLIQRKAYGLRSFENYRLRALFSCR